jgi:phage terminase large subunit-like protein
MTVATRPAAASGIVPRVDVADRATEYAHKVVDGQIVAGRLVRLACERHLRDIEHGHERGLRWDPALSEKAIDFFLFVHHFEGPKAGQPVELELWQCFSVGSIFGWQRWSDEFNRWIRRFRKAFNEVAKKNGKTLTAGGVGLRLAFFDDEAGAQVYAAATKRDQAKIVWGGAKTMTAQSPALRARISARVLSLYDAATASSFRPLGRDAGGEDGINPSAVIIDEEHRHEDRELINVLGQSMGARMQPLLYIITTAGTTGESVWADDHDYAVRVLEGLVDDDALFAVIYTLDEKDDPFDEANWPKANPNLGVSLTWSEMRQRAQEAREMPANLNDFLRLRLDVRTQSTTRWMAPEQWAACSAPVDALAGRLAYGGLDLGSRSDLAAFLAIVPVPGDDELLDVVCRFWCPEDGVEQRSKRDRVPYDVWVREGWITATPGNVTDYDRIRADLNLFIGVDPDAEEQSIDFADLYELGYDPHDATQLSTQLQSDGFRLVRIMQSTAELDAAVKEVERLVSSRKLRHGGNPVLAWMVDNALMVQDAAGRRRPDKEKARDKIDGVPALLMAVKRWMANAGAEDVWTAA